MLLASLSIKQLVDVGANEGQYARDLRECGYRRRIISCEPLLSAYEVAVAAARSDPDWTVRRIALGSHSGEDELGVSGFSQYSSLLPPTSEMAAADTRSVTIRRERVPVATLDEFVAENCDSSPLGLKIDAQGAEWMILDHGAATLDRARFVELELSPQPLYAGEASMTEMLARMDAASFTLALGENDTMALHGKTLQINGLFVRR
jgi:FkbM family methyltransferase